MSEHGAPGSWHNCQCHKCMDAFNATRQTSTPKRVDEPPHGDTRRYKQWHCRCDECLAAYNDYRHRLAAAKYLAKFGIDLNDVIRQHQS